MAGHGTMYTGESLLQTTGASYGSRVPDQSHKDQDGCAPWPWTGPGGEWQVLRCPNHHGSCVCLSESRYDDQPGELTLLKTSEIWTWNTILMRD